MLRRQVWTDATTERHSEERGVAEVDLEANLLEANRKRLLGQQDWIGIVSSTPVNLQFLSNKDKGRIGKRRRVHGRLRATARQRKHNDVPGHPSQRAGNEFVTISMSGGARPNDVEHVQVRIGTDALTDTYSTQHHECNQSQASSDSMLFGSETRDTGLMNRSQLAQPVRLQLPTIARASRHGCAAPHERPLTDEENQCSPDPTPRHKPNLPQCLSERCSSDHGSSDHNLVDMPSQDAAGVRAQLGVGITPEYQLAQHIECIKRPLDPALAQFSCSAEAPGHIAVHINIAKKKHAQKASPAEESQTRHARQVDSDNERSCSDEASAANEIVDEEPWKSFLTIPNANSRHSSIGIGPGNSLLHSYPTAGESEAVASWSQHATRGARTHISSSCTSASLPFLGGSVWVQMSGAECGRQGTISRGREEDEKLWQAFVFGSEDSSSSKTNHDHEYDSKQSMPRCVAEASFSRYLPLSVAVSSVSSTPFRSITGRASCITDNGQDAAASAPHSYLGTISSPAIQGFDEDLSDRVQGIVVQRSRMNERSVTHASLQNNASCDTEEIRPKIFSDTRTPRNSLGQPDCTKREFSARATVSNGVVGRPSSMYNVPLSDEYSEGLDLVDAGRL